MPDQTRDVGDRRTRELESLAEASHLLTSTLDLGEVLDRLADIARRRLAVDVVRIWLVDDSGETLSMRAQQGVGGEAVAASGRVPRLASLAGWIATEQTPIILPDARDHARLKNRDWFVAAGLISFLGV